MNVGILMLNLVGKIVTELGLERGLKFLGDG
jgi:hypothetical protein